MPDTYSKDTEHNYIPDSGCFARLLPDEIEYLNQHKSTFIYHKGETVCKESGFSSGVKYIIDGLVKIYIEGPKRRNIIVKLVGPGDFVGLSSLFENMTYPYSAAALNESTVFMISREAVLKLISKNGEFALEVAAWYCQSYAKAYQKLALIGFKNMAGRIADVILYLDQEKFRELDVYKYLSRYCIADLAGVPMESAVRMLSDLDRNGVIKLAGRAIQIINYDMLKTYSKSG